MSGAYIAAIGYILGCFAGGFAMYMAMREDARRGRKHWNRYL